MDHTYNQSALNQLVKDEKELNACLEKTPLGNEGMRGEFYRKMNNSRLRAVHETDRYFQDRMKEHNLSLN